MFGFSWGELLIVVIAGLLIMKPEDMPGMARDIMKWVRSLRSFGDEITREFKTAIDEATTIEDEKGNRHKAYDVDELKPFLKKKKDGNSDDI